MHQTMIAMDNGKDSHEAHMGVILYRGVVIIGETTSLAIKMLLII